MLLADSSFGEKSQKVGQFPLWKLALNVGTFAAFNLFYVIWAIGLLINTDRCFFLRNFAMMMRFLGMIRSSLLFRIVMDPILSFITDLQIRRSTLSMLGISGKVFPFVSFRKDMQSEEENSSECVGLPGRPGCRRVKSG
uniref:Uncharacterized protein n=1 Tax=Ditylenchus dipsaci TaxID=166011 RepID=A0A915DJ44_9BILA